MEYDERMELFDSLPKSLRKLISNSEYSISDEILKALHNQLFYDTKISYIDRLQRCVYVINRHEQLHSESYNKRINKVYFAKRWENKQRIQNIIGDMNE